MSLGLFGRSIAKVSVVLLSVSGTETSILLCTDSSVWINDILGPQTKTLVPCEILSVMIINRNVSIVTRRLVARFQTPPESREAILYFARIPSHVVCYSLDSL